MFHHSLMYVSFCFIIVLIVACLLKFNEAHYNPGSRFTCSISLPINVSIHCRTNHDGQVCICRGHHYSMPRTGGGSRSQLCSVLHILFRWGSQLAAKENVQCKKCEWFVKDVQGVQDSYLGGLLHRGQSWFVCIVYLRTSWFLITSLAAGLLTMLW